MADAGHGMNLVDIGALDLRVKYRTLLEYRILHAGDFDVDAELLPTLNDPGFVGVNRRRADDLESRLVLQHDRAQIRHRQSGGTRGELAVLERTAAGAMRHRTIRCGAFSHGHAP